MSPMTRKPAKPRAVAPTVEPRLYYFVMAVTPLESCRVGGFPVTSDEPGLVGLLPVYRSRDEAVAQANGNDVVEVTTVPSIPAPARPARRGKGKR